MTISVAHGQNVDVTSPSSALEHLEATVAQPDLTGVDIGLIEPIGEVQATAASVSEIQLSWTVNDTNADGIVVMRSVSGSAFSTAATLMPANGQLPTTYNDTNLDEGLAYQYEISVERSNNVDAAYSSASTFTPINAPYNLAGAVKSQSITLNWSDDTNANYASLAVLRSSDGGSTFSRLASLDPGADTYTDFTVGDSQQYQYEILVTGQDSADSVSATSAADAVWSAPTAPTGLSVAGDGTGGVQLSWTNNSSTNPSFAIERKLSSQDDSQYAIVGQTGANGSTYDDSSVPADADLVYRVEAVNAAGTASDPTAAAAITSAPAAPSDPTASSATAAITLQWANSSDTTAVILLRSDDARSYSVIETLSGSVNQYRDTGLSSDTQYFYELLDAGAGGNSAPLYFSAYSGPAAPQSLLPTPVNGTEIDLNWSDFDASAFTVQRSSDGGSSFTTVASNLTSDNYADTSLKENTAYIYRVWAIGNGGGLSDPVTATATTLLAEPADVVAIPGTTSVDLAWENASSFATGFAAEMSIDGSSWVSAGNVSSGSLSLTVGGLTESTNYYFRVKATAPGGLTSAPSNDASTTTGIKSPSNLTASAAGSSEIDLNWTNNSLVASGFEVLRGLTADSLTQDATLSGGQTNFSDTNLSPGTEYFYAIEALTNGLPSTPSRVSSAYTQPSAPINLTAIADGPGNVTLSWTNTSPNDGFEVDDYYNSSYTPVLTSIGAGTTTVGVSGLGEGNSYSFAVKALGQGSGNDSGWSILALVTTTVATPTDVSATPESPGEIDVRWKSGDGAFTLQRWLDGFQTSIPSGQPTFDMATGIWTLADTTVSPGHVYTYDVVANAGGVSSGASVQVSAQTQPPDAPTSLTAVAAGGEGVNLQWSSPASSFLIERSSDGYNYSPITPSVPSIGTAAGVWDCADTGLTPTSTYFYRISAVVAGFSSSPSSVVSVTTGYADPENVTAATDNNWGILLTWTDASAASSPGFAIVRTDMQSGLTYTVDQGDIRFDGQQYSVDDHASLNVHDSYVYAITAIGNSNSVSSGTATPTGTHSIQVSAAAGPIENGYETVLVSWSGTTGATVSLAGCTVSNPVIGPLDTQYIDGGHSGGDTATYVLTAVWPDGSSATQSSLPYVVPADHSINLSLGTQLTSGVTLSWTAPAGLDAFFVWRNDLGPGGLNGFPVGPALGMTDYSVSDGATYIYHILGERLDDDNVAAISNFLVVSVPLLPPQALIATPVSPSEVDLTWSNDTSRSVDELTVERSTDDITFTPIATLTTAKGGGAAGSYADIGLTQGTRYYYKIIAGPDAYGGEASAVVDAAPLPAQLEAFTANAVAPSKVDLSWINNATSASVEIDRAPAETYDFAPIATLPPGSTEYSDLSATEDSNYVYEARTSFDNQFSPYTFSNSVITPLATPTGLSTTAVTPTEVDLSWTSPSTAATSFVVSRSVDGNNWTSLATVTNTVYQDTSVTDGVAYLYQVQAQSDDASSPTVSLEVYVPPAAPTGLSGVWDGSKIDLSWTDNSASAPTFEIDRTSYMSGALAITTDAGANSYADGNVAELTNYTYSIHAIANGVASTAETLVVPGSPYPPTNLVASVVSTSEIDLSWTNNSQVSPGVEIQRSTDGVTYSVISNALVTGSTFHDASVNDASHYWYKVSAVWPDAFASNPPADSNIVDAWSTALAPANLAANDIATNQVQLTWTNLSAGASTIEISRSSDGGQTYSLLDTVDASASSYIDSTVDGGIHYDYEVTAQTADGAASTASTSASAQTAPAGVTALVANEASTSEIDLSWTTAVTDATGFNVYRSTDGRNFTLLSASSQLSATATGFIDTALSSNTHYWYQVAAIEPSGPTGVAAVDAYTLPPAPSGLQSTLNSDGTVSLTWTNNGPSTVPFEIETATSISGPFTFLDQTAAGATSYTDANPVDGVTTYYRGVGLSGDSAGGSASAAASTTVPLAPPSGLTATSIGSGEIDLSWTDNSVTATSYQVLRSTSSGGSFEALDPVDASSDPIYADTTVAPGTTYYYEVVAATDTAQSAPSATASAATDPNISLTGHDDVTPAVADGIAVAGTTYTVTPQVTPADETISSWNIDWGDGSKLDTSGNYTHVFAAPGNYTITATAVGAGGPLDTVATLGVRVPLPNPSLALQTPDPSNAGAFLGVSPLSGIKVPDGTPVSIAPNLSLNYALPAGTQPSAAADATVTYRIDWGDGTIEHKTAAASQRPVFSHTYPTTLPGYDPVFQQAAPMTYPLNVMVQTSVGEVYASAPVWLLPQQSYTGPGTMTNAPKSTPTPWDEVLHQAPTIDGDTANGWTGWWAPPSLTLGGTVDHWRVDFGDGSSPVPQEPVSMALGWDPVNGVTPASAVVHVAHLFKNEGTYVYRQTPLADTLNLGNGNLSHEMVEAEGVSFWQIVGPPTTMQPIATQHVVPGANVTVATTLLGLDIRDWLKNENGNTKYMAYVDWGDGKGPQPAQLTANNYDDQTGGKWSATVSAYYQNVPETGVQGRLIVYDEHGNEFSQLFHVKADLPRLTVGQAEYQGAFTPIYLKVPAGVITDGAKFTFTYSESDPTKDVITGSATMDDPAVFTPAPGDFTIWTVDGSGRFQEKDLSSGGNVINSGEAYSFSSLGPSEQIDPNTWVFYVEAVNGSIENATSISVSVTDGAAPEKAQATEPRLNDSDQVPTPPAAPPPSAPAQQTPTIYTKSNKDHAYDDAKQEVAKSFGIDPNNWAAIESMYLNNSIYRHAVDDIAPGKEKYYDNLVNAMAASKTSSDPSSSSFGWRFVDGSWKVVTTVVDAVRPHPVAMYNAASAQADIMLDPNQPTLNRIGGGFGYVGNTILLVTDLVPGVGFVARKLGLKAGEKVAEVVVEKTVEATAEKVIERGAVTATEDVIEKSTARTVSLKVLSEFCFLPNTLVLVARRPNSPIVGLAYANVAGANVAANRTHHVDKQWFIAGAAVIAIGCTTWLVLRKRSANESHLQIETDDNFDAGEALIRGGFREFSPLQQVADGLSLWPTELVSRGVLLVQILENR